MWKKNEHFGQAATRAEGRVGQGGGSHAIHCLQIGTEGALRQVVAKFLVNLQASVSQETIFQDEEYRAIFCCATHSSM